MSFLTNVNGLTDVSTETLTWETASDWDNAVSDTRMFHPGSTLRMGLDEEDWEDDTLGGVPSPWTEVNGINDVDNTRANPGSQSMYTQEGSSTGLGQYIYVEVDPQQYTQTFYYRYNESSSNTRTAIEFVSSSGDTLLFAGTDNPQVVVEDGSGYNQIAIPNESYDFWREFQMTFDWVNYEIDVTWVDIGGTTSNATYTGPLKTATSEDIERIALTNGGDDGSWGGNGEDCWNDYITAYPTTSELRTTTKTYSSARTPNLTGLSYSLNGESITLDITGSPGTIDTETVSQTLDGASSYTLNWNNSHSDFEVTIKKSTSTTTTSPTLDSITLEG